MEVAILGLLGVVVAMVGVAVGLVTRALRKLELIEARLVKIGKGGV